MTNLSGYKTYLLALLVGIVGAFTYLGNDPTYGTVLLAIAGLAATLRHAIENQK